MSGITLTSLPAVLMITRGEKAAVNQDPRNGDADQFQPWIAVTEHQALAPTGKPATYGVVSFKNLAMAILPLFDDGAAGWRVHGAQRFPQREADIFVGNSGLSIRTLVTTTRRVRDTDVACSFWLTSNRLKRSSADFPDSKSGSDSCNTSTKTSQSGSLSS